MLKMEENIQHSWHIIFFSRKVKNTTETQEMICAVCGEGAVPDLVCQE